jgi:hypothetical protein
MSTVQYFVSRSSHTDHRTHWSSHWTSAQRLRVLNPLPLPLSPPLSSPLSAPSVCVLTFKTLFDMASAERQTVKKKNSVIYDFSFVSIPFLLCWVVEDFLSVMMYKPWTVHATNHDSTFTAMRYILKRWRMPYSGMLCRVILVRTIWRNIP